MTPRERDALIAHYRAGHAAVVAALEGLDETGLDLSLSDGWTPRQIVHHLADSELTSAIRLRRLIAEDNPVIAGYDEETFAKRLKYDRPIHTSLEAIRVARESTAEILDRLTDEEWARKGTHTESGEYGVEIWLTIYAAHAFDHAEQIRRARSGK